MNMVIVFLQKKKKRSPIHLGFPHTTDTTEDNWGMYLVYSYVQKYKPQGCFHSI